MKRPSFASKRYNFSHPAICVQAFEHGSKIFAFVYPLVNLAGCTLQVAGSQINAWNSEYIIER